MFLLAFSPLETWIIKTVGHGSQVNIYVREYNARVTWPDTNFSGK